MPIIRWQMARVYVLLLGPLQREEVDEWMVQIECCQDIHINLLAEGRKDMLCKTLISCS